MPHLLHLGLNSDLCNEYLRNIYSTIFLKDIVSRENIRNVVFLEKLLQFTADNIGSLLSAWSISKYLKSQKTEVNHSVIINYLKAMCNAFIINKVSRYDIAGKKIFENNEKYYFEDLGIRNVLVGMNFARDINKLLENLVYQHLKISGYEVFVGKYNDKEIDFIGLKQGKTIYVQVAYMIENHTTETREFGNLESISDNYPKYVISMDKVGRFNDYNGIYHLNIRDFLLKQL